MKKFTYILLCLAAIGQLCAQNFSPLVSGVSNTFSSISFVDDSLGFAVGYSGVILKTNDGGLNWISQSSSISGNVSEIQVIDANNAFAVGDNGSVIKTTNGGNTWNSLNTGISTGLNRLCIIGNDIYVSGDNAVLIKSSDGGSTWITLATDPAYTEEIYEVYFVNSSIGFIVGDLGNIQKTVDAGATWTTLNTGTNFRLLGIRFIDSMNGIATGALSGTNTGIILKTSDGGVSWTQEIFQNSYFITVRYLNASTAYVVGGDVNANTSTIMKTTDGGNNWTVLPSNASRQVGMAIPSSQVIYTCGLDGSILKADLQTVGLTNVRTQEFELSLFPNPSSGVVYLKAEEFDKRDAGYIEVFNQIGVKVHTQTGFTKIDLHDFPKGMYYVKAYVNGSVGVNKVILH